MSPGIGGLIVCRDGRCDRALTVGQPGCCFALTVWRALTAEEVLPAPAEQADRLTAAIAATAIPKPNEGSNNEMREGQSSSADKAPPTGFEPVLPP
jgi:hypothetical protein